MVLGFKSCSDGRCRPIEILFLAGEGSAIPDTRRKIGDTPLPEYCPRKPGLQGVPQPGEEHQEQADTGQQQRFLQRVVGNLFGQHQAKGRPDYQDRQDRREQRVGEKAHERVEQDEPVVLQENEKRQWNSGVMQHQFTGPCLAGVAGPEMHEGGREQRQAHRCQNARAAASRSLSSASHGRQQHHRKRQYQKSDGDQHQGALMQRDTIARDLPEMHHH